MSLRCSLIVLSSRLVFSHGGSPGSAGSAGSGTLLPGNHARKTTHQDPDYTDETHTPNIHQDLEETDTMQNTKHNRIRIAETHRIRIMLGKPFYQHSAQDPLRHQDPKLYAGESKNLHAKIRTMLGKLRSQCSPKSRQHKGTYIYTVSNV